MDEEEKVLQFGRLFLILRADKFAKMVVDGKRDEALEWARRSIPTELMEEFSEVATERLAAKGLDVNKLWD